MIVDTIANSALYEAIHPLFHRAFEFLRDPKLATLANGKYVLDGDRLYANISDSALRPAVTAKPELHRKYIDIQYVISGTDIIGWSPLCGLGHIGPFDEKGDFGLADDHPQSWVEVRPGCFAILFPDDAHAPCVGEGTVRKVVIKVAVNA